jgi:hypothetical protein
VSFHYVRPAQMYLVSILWISISAEKASWQFFNPTTMHYLHYPESAHMWKYYLTIMHKSRKFFY